MRQENRNYYSKRFLTHGENVRSFWGSRESQEQRFSVLCRIGELKGTSVLDVGCGLGDFYGYLGKCSIQLRDYLGLDCVEETVAAARRRHPAARFETWDLLQLDASSSFDWVIGSGLFTLTGPQWNEYVIRMVGKMFSLARRGLGVNFLSKCGGSRDSISHYADPAEVLHLLLSKVSRIAELVHSYRPNDFTVFLYKEFQKTDP